MGNEKDQHNSGSYNPRTSKNSKNKTSWRTNIANDKISQRTKNKKTAITKQNDHDY